MYAPFSPLFLLPASYLLLPTSCFLLPTSYRYASFSLLVGAIVFGYMLSSIGLLVAALDRQVRSAKLRISQAEDKPSC